jgi:hypothetical protein
MISQGGGDVLKPSLNLLVEGSIPSGLTKLSSALSPGAKYLKNGAVAAVRLSRFPSNAMTAERLTLC